MFDWLFNRCRHYNRRPTRSYRTECVDCEKQFDREGKDWMRKVHHMRLVVLVRATTKISTMMADRADGFLAMRDMETASKWQTLAGRTNRLAMDLDDVARDVFEQNQSDAKLKMFE